MLSLRSIVFAKWIFSKGKKRYKHGGPAAFLFPGQGSQFVGMCRRFSKEPWLEGLFSTARSVLGYDLFKLCLEGTEETLRRTEHCQLAVVMASLASLEWHNRHRPLHQEKWYNPSDKLAAGYSVGEFTALVFGQSISLEDALKVVSIRAKAMQRASEEIPSGMVTVRGLLDHKALELCEAAKEWTITQHHNDSEPVAVVSSYLYPKCQVLAGSIEVVEYILEYGKSKHGAQDVTQLPVSGAFHSPLMMSAQSSLRQALDAIKVFTPRIPVYSNVTGMPYGSAEEIKRLLVQQLVHPIKWNHLITTLIYDESPAVFYEVGPGRQLNAMLCRIDSKYKRRCHNVEA